MENRIYVRDLDCYRLASEEERSGRLVSPDRFLTCPGCQPKGCRMSLANTCGTGEGRCP